MSNHENQKNNPPQWALRFLAWFCPEHLYEEIEGDLIQRFNRDLKGVPKDRSVKSIGHIKRRARRRFVLNALRFFRPGIIFRNRYSISTNPFIMVSHFLKIFYRTTRRNAGYSFINLSGLCMGLVCGIFIMLWVLDEVSYDTFHADNERIYKVMVNHKFPDATKTYDYTPGPLANALKDLPEVEASGRIVENDNILLRYKDFAFFEKAVYADTSVFRILTIDLLAGDIKVDNTSIAISEKLAEKYFIGVNAIGKTIRVDNNLDMTVKAVFKNFPSNSTFNFDLIIPYQVYAKADRYNDEWGAWSGGRTYVKLQEDADVKIVQEKIHKNFTKPRIWERWDSNVDIFLFPMPSWRLYENFNNGKQEGGRINYVIGFSVVGVFILLMACVNFMNLATARSMTRAREIGVRKVAGALRQSLIWQFIGEALVTSFAALLLALGFVYLLLPVFNGITGKALYLDLTNPLICYLLIGSSVLTGLAAGSYPAFLLSSFKPVRVLKGALSPVGSNGFRKTLVVFQFSLSIVLIVCALVVYRQLEFMRNKNLGFDRSNIFYFNSSAALKKNFEAFRNEALYNQPIKDLALSNGNPMALITGMVLADDAWPGKPKDDNTLFRYFRCDDHLLTTLGFTFVTGRNFSGASDSVNYIVNEEAVRRMKLADPIGQEIIAPNRGKIIGVVRDFHSSNFTDPIEPVIIAFQPETANRVFVRYEAGQLEESIKTMRKIYNRFEPDFPFEPGFMDDTFGRQYENEITAGKLSKYFTAIAIFISCLGLFGLASFSVERRAKEIGVRKVLGATAMQVIALLCREFVLLIALALLIGLPVAWWMSDYYLESYRFRIVAGVDVFMVVVFFTLFIAICAVIYQAARAACRNPVKTLRAE